MRPMLTRIILAGGILIGSAGIPVVHAAPLSLNVAASLADTKAILSSNGTAKIMCMGDSLTMRDGSYLPYFRQLLQQTYGDAGAGYQAFSVWTGAGFDQQWTWGYINWDTTPHRGLDGLWASSSASPWPPTHTAAYINAQNSRVEIHYIKQPGGGNFTIAPVNVGVVANIATDAPSPDVEVFSYTYNATYPRIWFQPQGNGQIVILGQDNIIDAPGVRIHRAANGGWGVGNFLQRDYSFDKQVQILDPDLITIWLGQNDGLNYNRATYAAAMGQLVDRLRNDVPDAEIVLIGTYNSGIPQTADLVNAMADVALLRNVGFMNIYEAGGPRLFYDANNYLDDGVHFNHRGGRYLGRLLFDAFETDGASLALPPTPSCEGDLNLDKATNTADLSVFLGNFGTFVEAAYTNGDMNGDRLINGADLSVLLADFGCTRP